MTENYRKITNLKATHPDVKVLLTVGGFDLGPGPFSTLLRSRSFRGRFILDAIRFLRIRNFDGLDIAWEYPADESRGGARFDKISYPAFLQVNFFDQLLKYRL